MRNARRPTSRSAGASVAPGLQTAVCRAHFADSYCLAASFTNGAPQFETRRDRSSPFCFTGSRDLLSGFFNPKNASTLALVSLYMSGEQRSFSYVSLKTFGAWPSTSNNDTMPSV